MAVDMTVFGTTITFNAGPIFSTTSTGTFLHSSSSLLRGPAPSTSNTSPIISPPAISTLLPVYSTSLSTASTLNPTEQGANVSSTLIPASSTYTTSQEHNTSASPSSSQAPPAASSSTSSDSAIIIGSSVGAAVLLCSIAIIAMIYYLRSRGRNSNSHAHIHPFEYTQPTASSLHRNMGEQRGYGGGHRPLSGSSESVTVVGAGDVDSPLEISDMLSGQGTLDTTASPSVVDVRPEEDRSLIARRERSRELKKLYPAQLSGHN